MIQLSRLVTEVLGIAGSPPGQAAAHARLLPLWLEGRADAPDLETFGEERFEDATAA